MSDKTEQLSPEQRRALLAQLLREKGAAKLKLAPLSFSQERLWFFEQLTPGSMAYMTRSVRMLGRLDVAALEQSLTETVRRHETLRTTFVTVDGQPMQAIAPPKPLALPVIDLGDLPADAREAEARRLVEAQIHRQFDLAHGPLFDASLLRLGDQEHILLLIIHHIISDGWSSAVLVRDLVTLYRAFATGQAPKLPPLPFQYADLARWQRDRLQGELLDAQLAYWKQQLSDALPLELPTDRPRLPGVTRGDHLALTCPLPLLQRLKALSQQQGVTLFMTLLAAFQALLYRYTGQTDISVGTFVANRTFGEVENLIGLLTNTLVLRTDLGGNPTFRELLNRVREVTLGAFAHQDIPFDRLLQDLHPERDLGRTPLFQVMLVLQNMPMPAIALPGLTLRPFRPEGEIAHTNADVALFVWEAEDGLGGYVDYKPDLFDPDTIQRMVRHWQNLMEAAVINPDERIAALPLMTAHEHHRLVVELNQTHSDYPAEATIQELFEAQVERTPDALAVSSDGENLAYAELDARANRLAHYLRRRGVGPDDLVGVAMTRSLDMIVALLGVLKAGGAYVPLDPAYPTERLAFMMSDARIKVLLTQAHLTPHLPAPEAAVVVLDGEARAAIAQESCHRPEHLTRPGHLAYVIYTSGSTGQPKGVMISQQGLVQYASAATHHFALTPEDRILQFASISFDTAAEEIYPCLLAGAGLVLRTEAMLDSIETFLRACAAEGITVLDLPTAYWHTLVAELETQALPFPTTLRLIILGGEKALPERVQTWRERAPAPIHLVNTYGPTEATIVATLCSFTGQDAPASVAQAPIGKPVANKQVYVLDAYGQPVPVGVPGELYLGGDGLARGYLNRPDLTAECFIPNPFGTLRVKDEGGTLCMKAEECSFILHPSSFILHPSREAFRLYKTGDRVRYLPDGHVEFLGRVDHQVKIRGFRVELGEIEAVLRQHPAVREAVVLGLERKETGENYLAAYVVPHAGQAPAAEDLKRFLKDKLPDYMTPAAFTMLETLPLTASGKVNRRALPVPDMSRPGRAGLVAPETLVEIKLAEIWQQILGIQSVSVNDSFFDLGGHSLRATQLMHRVNQTFRTNLPLREFFEEPTIAGLALLVEEALIEEIEAAEA